MSSVLIPGHVKKAVDTKDWTAVIAEDDDVVRGLLRGVLRNIGINVVEETRDGIQAVAAYARHKPHIVCLDIAMPNMDGLAALAKIREVPSNTLVLMVTGTTTAENVKLALAAGADGFIAKPFTAAKISQQIERALARRAQLPVTPPAGL